MGLNCKYCHCHNPTLVSRIDGYELIKCRCCKLLQTNITKYQLKKINFYKYSDNYLNNYIKIRSEQLIYDYKNNLIDIEKICRGGNILDVGCSTGLFIKTVYNCSVYRWNIFGIDINVRSIKLAKLNKFANVKRIDIKNNRFDSNYFDVITCFDVLEHLNDINESIGEIRRILKRGGILVIQIPNSDSLMRLLSGNDWDWWCIPDHIFHFTPDTITRILEDYGFTISTIKTFEHSEIFIKNIQGHIRKILIKKRKFNTIIAKLAYLSLYLLWFVMNNVLKNNKYGGLIYILAVKS